MSLKKSICRGFTTTLCCLAFTSCTTLVDRWTPDGGEPETPDSFRNATPDTTVSASGPWWKSYRDPVLNELMARVETSNPDVKSALARVDQANAALGITRSQLFPQVGSSVSASGIKDSANSLRFELEPLSYEGRLIPKVTN